MDVKTASMDNKTASMFDKTKALFYVFKSKRIDKGFTPQNNKLFVRR
jgi:hypothetical protein